MPAPHCPSEHGAPDSDGTTRRRLNTRTEEHVDRRPHNAFCAFINTQSDPNYVYPAFISGHKARKLKGLIVPSQASRVGKNKSVSLRPRRVLIVFDWAAIRRARIQAKSPCLGMQAIGVGCWEKVRRRWMRESSRRAHVLSNPACRAVGEIEMHCVHTVISRLQSFAGQRGI